MPTWVIVIGAIAACLAAWGVYVLWSEAQRKKAWLAQRAASESPATQLSHLRLVEAPSCMRCKKRGADDVDGIHCTVCAGEVRGQ
jgi:hypothetical protein